MKSKDASTHACGFFINLFFCCFYFGCYSYANAWYSEMVLLNLWLSEVDDYNNCETSFGDRSDEDTEKGLPLCEDRYS